jgi:hypothetical protein
LNHGNQKKRFFVEKTELRQKEKKWFHVVQSTFAALAVFSRRGRQVVSGQTLKKKQESFRT